MTSAPVSLSRTAGKARRLGQVFTPPAVADWMARWVCRHQPKRILDPAVGRGVFVDAIGKLMDASVLNVCPRVHVCEIDPEMLRDFARTPRRTPVRCRHTDFISARFRGRYDAVIANPPYVRHHDMSYDDATLRAFDRICRRRLSRMTNLYGLFLIKIWTLLADRGRAAVITPAEWLNADFGVALKAYLIEENAIDALLHFDHTATVFDGTLTTAAITLLRRDRGPRDPVRLIRVRSVGALRTTTLDQGRRMRPADLDPRAKWTPLFTADGPYRPTGSPGTAGSGRSRVTAAAPTLADIARCSRGIATGANDFFTLRESDRRRWKIDPRDLDLCITKAPQIPGVAFTRADVNRLIEADQRIYLLHPRPRLTAAVQRYLEEGRRRGIDERYLPSHRPVWYVPELREPAPILVSVFARAAFRFVHNRAAVRNLTAFHAVYPLAPSPPRIKAMLDYLNGPEAQRAIRHHCRIYADGLSKLEPRDVGALPIPDRLRELCQRPR